MGHVAQKLRYTNGCEFARSSTNPYKWPSLTIYLRVRWYLDLWPTCPIMDMKITHMTRYREAMGPSQDFDPADALKQLFRSKFATNIWRTPKKYVGKLGSSRLVKQATSTGLVGWHVPSLPSRPILSSHLSPCTLGATHLLG
jgi:hypothetical protein